jgi:general secretion pathway protein H
MSRGQSKEAGFTFVELMVVIFIIGLAATAVLLAVPDEGGSVYSEAERFAARAKTLRDKAIIESRPAAVRVGPGGYSLSAREAGEYKEFGRFEWASGTRATYGEGGETRFDATGMASPLTVTLERGQRQVAIEVAHDGSVHVRR